MTAGLERQCAEVASLATFTGLSPQQAYGEVCVGTCGRSFLQPPYPEPITAGIAEHGGIVFACPDCAAKPVDDGGLGMDPADGWQGRES